MTSSPQDTEICPPDPPADSRIAVSCSSCTYEFLFKPLPSVGFVTEAEGEVTRCSDEISRLREIIEKVEKHQAKLTHEISIHQTFMAPIRRLPPELLALIFSFFCTVDFWDCKPFVSKSNRMTGSLFREPFIIATVCNHWRSIALSTPSLWSTIMLGGGTMELSRKDHYDDPDAELDDSRTFPEDVLEVALERSGQHPLKLWIECFEEYYWPSILTTQLRQVCSRVRHIYLGGSLDPFYHPLAGSSRSLAFDRLSAVQVSPDSGRSMAQLPWLSTAANVQVLVLQNLEEAEAEFWTDLPVQSTQLLFFENTMITDAISTLSRFPDIVSSGLMCEFCDIERPLRAWISPKTLHHLNVTIQCYERECNERPHSDEIKACYCLENLLSNLTIPGLKSLRLEGDSHHQDIYWSQSHFLDFLDRSSIKESVTCISLHNIDGLDDAKFVKVFQSLRFLTSLTVSSFDDKPIIMDTLDAVVNLVRLRSGPGKLEEIVVRMEKLATDSERVKRFKEGMELNFKGTRYTINQARSYPDYPSFNEWLDEIQRV
ncbi:hypothetical protein C8J56DRAFT_1051474 [Mycena floridula]|nr:hypothetical protein C8J56DRAFT_1051474 [Mycena floridula]